MALQRNRNLLANGIERIDVRNLMPPSGVDVTLFSPSIEVLAVCKDSNGIIKESFPVFKGEPQFCSCNPSWISTSRFGTASFCGLSEATGLIVRFTFNSENEENDIFHEVNIDIGKLFRLENFSMTSLQSVPRYSIFFWMDDKTVLMENSVYIALRKSRQINARSGSVAIADDKQSADFGLDSENANERILNEMNSVLIDENERNTALREEIDASFTRVSALRTKAESIFQSIEGSTSILKGSDNLISMGKLEIGQLQVLVERAESEVNEYEQLLVLDEKSLELAKKRLDDSLRQWKDTVTESNNIQSIEGLIGQKKNELVYTKFLLDARRIKLFGELSTIYPIAKVIRSGSDKPSGGKLLMSSLQSQAVDDEDTYAIRGIELPLIIDASLKDDEQISTALGYIVHILLLTSKYLQICLRYELIYNSSRSSIRDAVLGRGSTLPLYKRGVERERFDRALIWLQKNIEQLMDRMGYKYSRKNSMLYNLNLLFDCEICPKLVS